MCGACGGSWLGGGDQNQQAGEETMDWGNGSMEEEAIERIYYATCMHSVWSTFAGRVLLCSQLYISNVTS